MRTIELNSKKQIEMNLSEGSFSLIENGRIIERICRAPFENRKMISNMSGWIGEFYKNKAVWMKSVKQSTSLNITFLSPTDVQINYYDPTNTKKTEDISQVQTIEMKEENGVIKLSYGNTIAVDAGKDKTQKQSLKKETDAVDEELKNYNALIKEQESTLEEKQKQLENLKIRLKQDAGTAELMEEGKLIKKGIIFKHLDKAEEELAEAERLIGLTISARETLNKRVDKATLDNGLLD